MRGLRRRWYRTLTAGPRAARAIADREDVVVPRRLQRPAHDELVEPVGFQSVDLFQEIGRLDSRRPDFERRMYEHAIVHIQTVLRYARDAFAGVDGDVN